MALTAGTSIGAYQIIEPLGAGGMGEVYRARDRNLGRDVAVKVLPSSFALDPDRVARFEREARLLAALSHPNIAAIHAVEDFAGHRALVLELVEGPTLTERLATGPVPLQEALAIARQIALALEAAHAQGIVHRDLKPANIKVRPDGTVKVLDFGLAKMWGAVPEEAEPTITAAGTHHGAVLGTPAYMSPEQARGQALDKRTDIWAFGCVLFEMLAGRRAHAGATVSDTIVAVLEREPDWSALPEATPPGLRRVLRRCLTKDPARRLHDIGDARIEIEDAFDGSPEIEPHDSTASGMRSRHGWRAGLAGAAIVGAMSVAVGWTVYSNRTTPNTGRVVLSVLPARGTSFVEGSGGPWPSVSPDGRHLAFVAGTSDGQQQLWLRSLDNPSARPLQGTEGAMRPFWSPDSRSLAFFANGQLMRVDVASGSPRVVCAAPYVGGMAGAWGDGVILFNHVGGLRRVAAEGGPSSLIVPASNGANTLSPSFLPDGRRFIYLMNPPRPEPNRLCVGSIESQDTRCLLDVDSPVRFTARGFLVFVRDGALQAQAFDASDLTLSGEPFAIGYDPIDVDPVYNPPPFSVSDDGILAYHPGRWVPRLAWVNRAGARLDRAAPQGTSPAISPDETRVIVQRRDPQTRNTDLWFVDENRNIESRFTFDAASDTAPAISPDGQRVVFVSTRNGVEGLYEKGISGTQETLVLTGRNMANPEWSSDGRHILYQAFDLATGWDLWAIPLAGKRQPFAVATTEHGEREGSLSPDTHWVAYDSTESGRRDVWIQPFPPTGNRWQISSGGGVSPKWRGDGKELFYVAADGTMMAVAIDAASTTPTWGRAQRLFPTMFGGGSYATYAVARDGHRFLMNVPAAPEETTPITVVLNWSAAQR